MNDVLIAAAVVSAIGALCAIMLVVAAKFFGVKEDEKYNKIRECLPGANCGACGYENCQALAKAIASKKASPEECLPIDEENSDGNNIENDIELCEIKESQRLM